MIIKGRNKMSWVAHKIYRLKRQGKQKKRRIGDESGLRLSRQMLLEHQGMSPASHTAKRSIPAQHSKKGQEKRYPEKDGKNKWQKTILTLE